jgi:hypothetical protein
MKYFLTLFTIFIFISLHSQQPEIGDTLKTFDMGSLTPTPDRAIVGIEYAEGYFWATGFDPDDYWQHKLYKISADGNTLVDTYSYGIEAAGWKDMAYDGEFLYVTDMDTIRQVDLTNGQKTGIKIPAPFYYNQGLAYNPLTDHFFVIGDGGSNIYEIDREGEIVTAISNNPDHGTGGLAVDTTSPGGPFLWTWSSEYIGYESILKASQISLSNYQFTGLEFEGISISNIIVESPGGATIIYDYEEDKLVLATVNIRNGNANDQMEYAVLYNITNDEVPGPQIVLNPSSIQNTLPPGDSIDIEVSVINEGSNILNWSAFLEFPNQDTIDNLGDTLYTFNGTQQTQINDRGLNAITFLNDHIWINGRNFPNDQKNIYKFSKTGELQDTYPYFSINGIGFRTITNDGEFLYFEDTYSINQVDPETFETVGYILKPSGSFSGLTYDPQTDHFWGGSGTGLIIEFDRDGNEINTFLTPYDIQGLAWDQWSPGGPYLWAWVETNASQGSRCEAVRLNPSTCFPEGDGFLGYNFSNLPGFQDTPEAAVITNQWEENKVTFLGLQNAGLINGLDTLNNVDFIGVYDLDVIPAPGWIELLDPSFGSVEASETGSLFVRLRSIMDDTLMTAAIRIVNNSILNPEVIIPVNFTMLPFIYTNVSEVVNDDVNVLGQNFPNPYITHTIIPVALTRDGYVALKIYNSMGVNVANIYEGWLDLGYHEFKIALPELKSGIYYYILQVDNQEYSNKMLVLPQ